MCEFLLRQESISLKSDETSHKQNLLTNEDPPAGGRRVPSPVRRD